MSPKYFHATPKKKLIKTLCVTWSTSFFAHVKNFTLAKQNGASKFALVSTNDLVMDLMSFLISTVAVTINKKLANMLQIAKISSRVLRRQNLDSLNLDFQSSKRASVAILHDENVKLITFA